MVHIWRKAKVSILGTVMSCHNAQNSGNPACEIPCSVTRDPTAEIPVHPRILVMARINNLLDRQ
jgi:hypothetical protein